MGIERYAAAQPIPVLTINEAARFLNVGRSTIYRLLRAGELQSTRVGKRKRLRPEDLHAYLERNREITP
jgi:excisionase family DNA binding protein